MRKTKFKILNVHEQTFDKISELSKICGCSKAHMIDKLVNPIFDVANIFQSAEIESYPLLTKSCCHFQVYGKNANLIFGTLKQKEDLEVA